MIERAAREAAQRSSANAAGFFGKSGLSFDDMVEAGYIVLGDPDQVAERIVELTTSLNVGHLMALCQFGDMGRELTMHNTELMATKVLPQVSDLFEDQWANTWWPVSLGGTAT